MEARRYLVPFLVLLMAAMPLVSCGATTPTALPTQPPAATQVTATKAAPTQASPSATSVPPTATRLPATATPKGPTVGGKLVWSLSQEPDTLDAHKSSMAVVEIVMSMLGSSLVARDPSGKFVGYLAESWKASADGLTWDFKLKKGVKFHDGSPLTAQDYAWTLTRALDPATKSPSAGPGMGPVTSAKALDDQTVSITLSKPFFPLLMALSASLRQPLSKEAVEKGAEQYGRKPTGVGPYLFKEWKAGSSITLERNPDFAWGPAFTHGGPFYIQTIEFRIIPELSTMLAGLEAGEITYADQFSGVQAKDISRIKATNKFQVFESYQQGARPELLMNVDKEPFTDVRVRKAFNLAMDRQAMIKTLALGAAIEQKGELTPSQIGYWPGVEEIGYGFDLSQAKDLMKQAGYTPGADGILMKDDKPLRLTLESLTVESWIKVAEMAKEQFKALGVSIDIRQSEAGMLLTELRKGNFELSVMGTTASEADVLFRAFHSSGKGGTTYSQVADAELDAILMATRTTTDPDKRQEFVNQAQQMLIEKAYTIPLYVPINYAVLDARVKGVVFSATSNMLYLDDAYFETK